MPIKRFAMKKIHVLDKEFQLSIPHETILASIQAMAEDIHNHYKGRTPLFLSVLNGAFMFTADLLKHYKGDCEISFVKLASYRGTTSSGDVKSLIGLNESLKNREVLILEDIVDSGLTIAKLVEDLAAYEPESIRVATLLLKPDALSRPLKLDFVGMEIPNDFIVGYGLDYDGRGRNYPDIYKIIE